MADVSKGTNRFPVTLGYPVEVALNMMKFLFEVKVEGLFDS